MRKLKMSHRGVVAFGGAVILCAVSAAALFLLAGVYAQDKPKSADNLKPMPADSVPIQGEVIGVDPLKKQITIRTNDNKDIVLTADVSSKLRVNEKDTALAEIPKGTNVTVRFMTRGGLNQLIALEGTLAATSKPKANEDASNPTPITVVGTIGKVRSDLSQMTLKVAPSDKEITLFADDRIKWEIRNQARKLTDLSEGTQVKVVYVLEDGKNMIVSITDNLEAPKSPGESAYTPGGAGGSSVGGQSSSRNALTGKILRIKKDLMIVQTAQGDLVVLSIPKNKEEILMDDKTAVKVDNRDAKLGDLREGENIIVDLAARDGHNYATLITGVPGGIGAGTVPGAGTGSQNVAPGAAGNVAGSGVPGAVGTNDGFNPFAGLGNAGVPFFPGFSDLGGGFFGGSFPTEGTNLQVIQGAITQYQGNTVVLQTTANQTVNLQNFQVGSPAGVTYDRTTNTILLIASNPMAFNSGTGTGNGTPGGNLGTAKPGTPAGATPPAPSGQGTGKTGSTQAGNTRQPANGTNQNQMNTNNLATVSGQITNVQGQMLTLQVATGLSTNQTLSLRLPDVGTQVSAMVMATANNQFALVSLTTMNLNQQGLQSLLGTGNNFLTGTIKGYQGNTMIFTAQDGTNLTVTLFPAGSGVTANFNPANNTLFTISSANAIGASGTGTTGTGGSVIPPGPQPPTQITPPQPPPIFKNPGDGTKPPKEGKGSGLNAMNSTVDGVFALFATGIVQHTGEKPAAGGAPPAGGNPTNPADKRPATSPPMPPAIGSNPPVPPGTTPPPSSVGSITGQVISDNNGVIIIQSANMPGFWSGIRQSGAPSGSNKQPAIGGTSATAQPAQKVSLNWPQPGTQVSIVVQQINNQNMLVMLTSSGFPLPIFSPQNSLGQKSPTQPGTGAKSPGTKQ